METYSKKQGLRKRRVLEYSLQSTHALTGAHRGISVEYNQRCWQLVYLAVCQDYSCTHLQQEKNLHGYIASK
jgi:hypothetical protein